MTVLMASCYGQSWASYFTKVIIILHIMLLLRNIIIISKLYILPKVRNRASLLWTLDITLKYNIATNLIILHIKLLNESNLMILLSELGSYF